MTRHVVQVKHFIGIENRLAVEWNMVGARGSRARGEKNVAAVQDLLLNTARDFHPMRIEERRFATDDVNAIAGKLILNDLPFRLADVLDHQPQVIHGDVAFATIAFLVNAAMAIAGEVQNSFANRL